MEESSQAHGNSSTLALLRAIREDNVQKVGELVARDDIVINYKNNDGEFALLLALCNNEILNRVLRAPAVDVYMKDNCGDTAMHVAVKKNYVEAIKTILEHDKLCMFSMEDDDALKTPLEIACSTQGRCGVVHAFFKHLTGLYQRNKNSTTTVSTLCSRAPRLLKDVIIREFKESLLTAVKHERKYVVRIILEYVTINEICVTFDPFTLHAAVDNNSVEITRMLLEHDRRFVYVEDFEGHTALRLQCASVRPNREIIRLLLCAEGLMNIFDSFDRLASRMLLMLLSAVINDDLYPHVIAERTKQILLVVFDDELFQADDNNQERALDRFVRKYHSLLVKIVYEAARYFYSEVVHEVLEFCRDKLDVSSTTTTTVSTPLHAAAESGDSRTAEYLLEYDARALNSYDSSGLTPLHVAAKHISLGVVTCLLKNDLIEVNKRTSDGQTLFQLATSYSSLVHTGLIELLLADERFEHPIGVHSIYFVQLWTTWCRRHEAHLEDAISYYEANQCNEKLLLYGAAMRDNNCVQRLVEEVPNLYEMTWNMNDGRNRTVLHWAAVVGHFETVKFLVDRAYVHGLDTECKDADGLTAMRLANRNGHYAVSDYIRTKPCGCDSAMNDHNSQSSSTRSCNTRSL